MAGERVFACRYFKHPTNDVSGVTHVRVLPSTVSKVDQGAAGSPGRADGLVTDKGVVVEVYGKSYAALIALLGVKANGVVGTEGAAGANEKLTVKNVSFVEPIPAIDIPPKDEGGKLAPFGVRGIACWGGADTFATMIAAAADS